MSTRYKEINKKAWNSRVQYHVKSEFYEHESFLKGRSSLNTIELDILGDIKGLRVLHLQCHFGQDSISLARMGAKVTGVDLSDKAIDFARITSAELGVEVDFICSDVFDLPEILDKKFDLVFSSYGTIGWLPDMNMWGKTVNSFLRPGGKLLLVEFHPLVWMWDDDFEEIKYTYFNSGAIVEEEGSYVDDKAEMKAEFVSWNHSLSEVMMGIINNGLEIISFQEYNYSPYNCFLGCEKVNDRKFQIKKLGNKIPLVYSLYAEKR